MKIDIQEIVVNKLREMEEGKVLETLIQDTVEKSVTKAITDAIDGYSIKRRLEEKIEKDVNAAIADIGFTAYNTIIVGKMQELMQSVVNEDLATKVTGVFEKIMLNKRETIKLSEICEEYKKVMENLDYDDRMKLDEGSFYVDFQDDDDSCFRHIKLTMALEEQSVSRYSSSGSDDNKLEISFSQYIGSRKKVEAANISCVKYEGKDLTKMNALRYMSEFEAMLINLYFNKTPVIIDIDSEDDIDNYIGCED